MKVTEQKLLDNLEEAIELVKRRIAAANPGMPAYFGVRIVTGEVQAVIPDPLPYLRALQRELEDLLKNRWDALARLNLRVENNSTTSSPFDIAAEWDE